MSPRAAAFVALGLGPACQAPGGDPPVFTSSPPTSSSGGEATTTGPATTTTSTGPGSGSGGSSTSSGATTTGELSTGSPGSTASTFDVGFNEDLGADPPGCKGKIDFLFVISRDGNMQGVQEQLIQSFPGFMETIAAKFEDFDFHVMAVAADGRWGLDSCVEDCPVLDCSGGEPCCPAPDFPCSLMDLVGPCDATVGAGSVFPAGAMASNEPCALAGGRRYMTKAQPELAETFACAAQVGVGGWSKIGDALVAAVSPKLTGAGGCNEGFLRDDALLMVTLVTAGYDYGSSGTAASWAKAILKAKNDDPEAAVVFVIGNEACPAYDEPCQMALMFPFHYIGDTDAPDYGPAFEVASDLAIEACAELVPG